jgi:hypothetical protein
MLERVIRADDENRAGQYTIERPARNQKAVILT